MSRPLVGCTMGDPAGVGPEVVLKSCAQDPDAGQALLILGDPEHLRQVGRRLGLDLELRTVAAVEECRQGAGQGPWVLPCARVEPDLSPGRPRPADGRAALDCIAAGADLAAQGQLASLATAPVGKAAVAAVEPAFSGHTEYLAQRAGGCRPLMVFVGPRPAVALLTTHLPLRTAVAAVNRRRIEAALRTLDEGWRRWFGTPPRIAVAGLNPHAGEDGLLGTEEQHEVLPAMAAAQAAGIRVAGPFPADSVFRRPDIDVVLALYHDQGAVMAKRAGAAAVNLTLGLPYPRTSPDHGAAYDIAGSGAADPASMLAAIRLAAELGVRRRAERA